MARTDPHEPTTQEAVTGLILRVFRANGALLQAGDRLVAPVGLTSARWQLANAIDCAAEPQSVAQLARELGVSRQAVQRIANDLAAAGLVTYRPNPRHKRAQLLELTAAGSEAFHAGMMLQRPWAARLGQGLEREQVEGACAVLDALVSMLTVETGTTPDAV